MSEWYAGCGPVTRGGLRVHYFTVTRMGGNATLCRRWAVKDVWYTGNPHRVTCRQCKAMLRKHPPAEREGGDAS